MRKFFKHPWLIVLVITVLTVFFAIQLPRAELDNNNLRFVPENDEARLVSQWIDDTFGSSLFILVGLERKYGTVFDPVFLSQLREYVKRVEEIEFVDSVNSLVTTDYITGDADAIVVEKLVGDDFSGSPDDVAELKRRVLSWDMYERALISDDFTATQVLIPLSIASEDAGRPEVTESFFTIRDTAEEMFDGVAEVYVTGMPVISSTVNEAVSADLILLVPLVVIVVLGILFFSFRRFAAVVLPLLTVLIATIWAIGAMPLFGVKLSIISTVLPVILVAVGSAYGIHVVTHYMTDRGKKILSRDEHTELVFELMRKIGKPVFLAALTTFVGFFSCCFTTVLPIREFGVFSSFGVMAAFAVAITLIPSLILIRGPKVMGLSRAGGKTADSEGVGPETPDSEAANSDPLSIAIADAFTAIVRKRRFVIFAALLVVAVSLYGLSKIIIDNIMVEYFKPDTDIYRSEVFIREKFGGSKIVSVVFEADNTETLLHPASLGVMDGLNTFLAERVPEVGKAMGFTDLVKRINQVFNIDESPNGIPAARGSGGGDSGFGFGGDSDADFGFGNDSDAGFGFGDSSDDGFGFGDDFGFGGDDGFGSDFGFGEDSDADFASENEDFVPRGEDPRLKVYNAGELAAIFDRAGAKARNMDANDLVWELKRQVNYEGAAYYEIPVDPARYGKTNPEELQRLVSNYLVLLSGNISDYSNDPLEPTAIKTTVQLRTVGQHDSDFAYREIDNYLAANLPSDIRVTVGGSSLVEASLNSLVVQSQLISVIVSLALVFIIIAISNRSLLGGFIGIAPLSISILINFAVMGFVGIKLNIGTAMVASVSVGIGIDYTIHFLEAYKREYRAAGGKGDFLRRAFATSGKAILINAVSVGAGFAVLLFSQFNMLADLGLLIALTMGTSAVVSLTVIPVLLMLFKPKFIKE